MVCLGVSTGSFSADDGVCVFVLLIASLVAQTVKNLPAMWET